MEYPLRNEFNRATDTSIRRFWKNITAFTRELFNKLAYTNTKLVDRTNHFGKAVT